MEHLAAALDQSFGTAGTGPVGLAVSGGGDSVALLLLAADWSHRTGQAVHVATVDHGLRDESAKEAEFVEILAASLGIPHSTLRWSGWDQQGNLQNEARNARKRLLSMWARSQDLDRIATGHTRDDQAETFLLRLARGSGVDGLSAMAAQSRQNGLTWLRPLLTCSRAELRSYLKQNGQTWIEDPSNDDPKFGRVKMRNAAGLLNDLGLSAETLAETAERMQSARAALELAVLQAARDIAVPRDSGTVRLQHGAFFDLPEEIRLRLMTHCLKWASGAVYGPRLSALRHLMKNLSESRGHTLSGCRINAVGEGEFEVAREASAMSAVSASTDLFDGRWHFSGQTLENGAEIRALGENGILQRPDWRQTAESRNAILAIPSIWYNNELMSVPFLDKDRAWTCKLVRGVQSFFGSIQTH